MAMNPNPPSGFQATVAFRGLSEPVAVQFANDGRMFVAEKPGIIKVFHGLGDTSPTTVADLRTEVYSYLDHGLLGIALDPNFPAVPYLYAIFTRDSLTRGGPVPAWRDGCLLTTGCTSYSRLVRYTLAGDTATSRLTLVDDWCEQSGSHSIGAIAFGADGMLYTGGGDGALYNTTDWGQFGNPKNPCADPPGAIGSTLSPPTTQGGSLRAQDARTTADPTGLSGALVRLNPATGAASAGNPFINSTDANQRRIVAYGIRNPFRIAIRPGTNEVYVGDVGWNFADEINVVADGADATAENFGWPCYEADQVLPAWSAANINLCTSLYATTGVDAAVAPAYSHLHSTNVVAGEPCPAGASALSGVAFYGSGSYPSSYNGGLFFTDYTRQCIWFAPADAQGRPDFSQRQTFMVTSGHYPVDLQIGPGGDLYYVDLVTGEVMRIRYFPANVPPIAAYVTSASAGVAPFTVAFDARTSSDADPGDATRLAYAWDLDDDGQFDDSTAVVTARTYTAQGPHNVVLRVTDPLGATDVVQHTIVVGHAPVVTVVTAPSASSLWSVGDTITFGASASDVEDGNLPSSAMQWDIKLQHCDLANHCHAHTLQSFSGVDQGTFTAPDHAAPAYLHVIARVADSEGITTTSTVRLNPRTTTLRLASNPPGIPLLLDGNRAAATTTVIAGSQHIVAAPTTPTALGTTWDLTGWSDSLTPTHTITITNTPGMLTASFTSARPPLYRISDITGRITTFTAWNSRVAVGPLSPGAPWVIGGARTADGTGSWRVDAFGRVSPAGAAQHFGDTSAIRLHQAIVGMAATPSGRGYWLVAADGGVFSFGDAKYYGSTGAIRLAKPIVAMMVSPTGRGYWLIASDGGIFSFGDARFAGSLGAKAISAPIVSGVRTADGRGYYLLGRDGAIYAFGSAVRRGAAPTRVTPYTAMLLTPSGAGYWILNADGGIRTFGDAPHLGSNLTLHLNSVAFALF